MANPINVPNMGETASTGSMVAAEMSAVEHSGLKKADILAHFAQHDMMDEITIGNKYLDYYYAVKDECPETADICLEMAKDEFTHARAQKHCLLDNGYSLTEDGKYKYDELKKRIEEAFR